MGRALRLALLGAAILAAVVVKLPLCPFAIVTRHPCPGCGLTRATLAMAHGEWAEALHFHPLAPVMSPVILMAFAINGMSYVRTGRWQASETAQGRWLTRGALALTVAMMVVWVARFFGAFGGPVPV
ncbi:MAG: DUF2752 domain-containing protein [Byssovorax sp.]